jgi:hypothetical protein
VAIIASLDGFRGELVDVEFVTASPHEIPEFILTIRPAPGQTPPPLCMISELRVCGAPGGMEYVEQVKLLDLAWLNAEAFRPQVAMRFARMGSQPPGMRLTPEWDEVPKLPRAPGPD